MKGQYQDNYELVMERWKEMSLTWNWRERFDKLGLSGYHGERPEIVYYGVRYAWNPDNGSLEEVENPDRQVDFQTAMNIYQLIYHDTKYPILSGNWVPLREVKRAYPFALAFQAATIEPFAKYFDGKLEKLIAAGEQLGFKRISHSDAGFEAEAFSCLPIRFLFWDGDDEFTAQANILFDANIVNFVHEENVVMLGSDGTKRLMDAAKLV